METKEKVLLIADLFTPLTTRSSTQLVIFSIIESFLQNNVDFVVLGIYDFRSDRAKIENFLKDKNIKFILTPSKVNSERNSSFKNLLFLGLETLLPRIFLNKKIRKELSEPDRIVCCVPSIEAGDVGITLKKHFKKATLVSVWTDVITYNFLNDYKKIPFSRKRFLPIEKKILRLSNNIFYLGKTQMEFQKKAFPAFSKKMKFYHPSFYPYSVIPSYTNKKDKKTVLYFGNMNSKFRDLVPLSEAAKQIPSIRFRIIGTGDKQPLVSSPNIEYEILSKKIDNLKEALSIECSGDIYICFLNKIGFSLPGKIFYYTNIKRPIVIVRGGPFQREIENELAPTKRFVFCDNNPDDLFKTIQWLAFGDYSFDTDSIDYFTPKERYLCFLKNN